MTEEPYRWLEAIGNRREYVREQLKGASPVLAASLPDGILLLAVSKGHGKVFEIHDRLAMGALGHPADIERIRQSAIDAAHLESFTRSAEDLSLRRLVGFGLSASLKQNFEQLFTAPVLGEFVFAELGTSARSDLLVRLRFDGSFQLQEGGVMIAAPDADAEAAALRWVTPQLNGNVAWPTAAAVLLEAWWMLSSGLRFDERIPSPSERDSRWREATADSEIELGWLDRVSSRRVRYRTLDPALLPAPATELTP